MQSNPQSNPVFWNGFQIQVQSTKKECNQDFAILQSQSYRCLSGPHRSKRPKPHLGSSMTEGAFQVKIISFHLDLFKTCADKIRRLLVGMPWTTSKEAPIETLGPLTGSATIFVYVLNVCTITYRFCWEMENNTIITI